MNLYIAIFKTVSRTYKYYVVANDMSVAENLACKKVSEDHYWINEENLKRIDKICESESLVIGELQPV